MKYYDIVWCQLDCTTAMIAKVQKMIKGRIYLANFGKMKVDKGIKSEEVALSYSNLKLFSNNEFKIRKFDKF